MPFKKGLENVIHDPEVNQKIRISLKNAHKNKTFGFKKRNKTKSQIKKEDWKNKDFARKHLSIDSPNYLERVANKIIQESNPFCYKFCGNDSETIDGKIPDFIYHDGKKIIEIYGENWHTDNEIFERIAHFKRHNYDTLIIWSHEIKNNLESVKFKIWNFTNDFHSIPIYLTKNAYLKLKYFITESKDEISGFGRLKQINPSLFVITDFEIYQQKCSKISSILDEDFLAKILYQKVKNAENISELKVWFHSHSNMSCFWSQIDEKTIQENTNDFHVSIVANKKMEILCRIDITQPIKINNIPVVILLPKIDNDDEKLKELCKKEIEEKVKII